MTADQFARFDRELAACTQTVLRVYLTIPAAREEAAKTAAALLSARGALWHHQLTR